MRQKQHWRPIKSSHIPTAEMLNEISATKREYTGYIEGMEKSVCIPRYPFKPIVLPFMTSN